MKLIIDSGNSRTKYCVAMHNQLQDTVTLPNSEILEHLTHQTELLNADQIIISATSSERLASEIAAIFPKTKNVILLSHETPLPITIAYDTPHTLGRDRIANACAAASLFPEKTSLIIDAGTCITYDVLHNGETFSGGAISPGLQMRFKAMNDYSARLPRIKQLNSHHFPGKSTDQSLMAGVFYGILGEIHQFIQETKQSFGQTEVLLTGGDTFYFEKAIKYPTFADSKLTLLGLHEILQHVS